MVSNRNRYVSESTSDDETADMEYLPNNQVFGKNVNSLVSAISNMSVFAQAKPPRKPTRTPKCFSKNALMARENRLKKKMYITTLENQVSALKNDNKKLSHTVDCQAETIEEMKKEVKYLKSILANSEGIGKLLQAINSSTGMAVSSSITSEVKPASRLGNSSPIAERTVPKIKTPKEDSLRKVKGGFDITRHPWEEDNLIKPYETYPTPESSDSYYGSPEFEELNSEGLLLDMDLPIEMNNDELLDMIDEKALESPIILPVQASNYHSLPVKSEINVKQEDVDVGVCLHLSKNQVSLEFCPSCSDKALQSWKLK